MARLRKAGQGFEVRVSFEPNRLAEEYLQQAYAQLAPIARRPIDTGQANVHLLTKTYEARPPRAEGER